MNAAARRELRQLSRIPLQLPVQERASASTSGRLAPRPSPHRHEQPCQLQLDGLERFDPRALRRVVAREHDARRARPSARDRGRHWMAIGLRRSNRARHRADECPGRRQSASSPPDHIGANDLVRSETHVDIGEDPPSAGSAATVVAVEWTADEAAYACLRAAVLRQRPLLGRDRSGDHFGTFGLVERD